jgi:hypothetical protein
MTFNCWVHQHFGDSRYLMMKEKNQCCLHESVRARVPSVVKRNEIRTERSAFHRWIHCALRRGAGCLPRFLPSRPPSLPPAKSFLLPPNLVPQFPPPDLRHSPPFKSWNRREQRDTAVTCASASSSSRCPLLRFLRCNFICVPRCVILNAGAHRMMS